MDTDRNLLFGVLALQADLIDSRQFIDACLLWTSRKDVALADLLLERGWIVASDRAHLDYLLERKLRKHGGDPRASLAAIPDDVKRSLAALGDDDIQRSLAHQPGDAEGTQLAATVDHFPGPHERYSRLRLHATGGIGRVWLAHDGDLGRDVALKELRPERAEQAVLAARFLQEARITGQLEHPGVVPVYELARRRDDCQPFYTMRFVKGRTLSEAARAYHDKRLAGQADALDLPVLLNAFVTVCNTVAYAHSRGVIHRDLKGQNVILGDFGEVVVLDWGLAKLVGRPEGEPQGQSVVLDDAGADSGYTVQGQTLGTPAYMSPEQAAGRIDLIDRRSDVYGLGAILYEILAGEPPFTGPSTEEVLRKVREVEPPAAPAVLDRGAPRPGGRVPAGSGQAADRPTRGRGRTGPGGPGLAGVRAAQGGGGAARIGGAVPLAGGEPAVHRHPQGPGRPVHLRQPPILRVRGPSPPPTPGQDRLRHLSPGPG
jgi:tRNA A-37 threonylcarbamoyl transferase component Bud32